MRGCWSSRDFAGILREKERTETMKRMLTFLGAFMAVAAAAAAELTALSTTSRPFSFAVLGDIHYAGPVFKQRQIAAAIAEAARAADPAPAFVCQTGDLILGEEPSHKQLDRAGVTAEMNFAVSNLTAEFGLPLFVAVGNHDKNAGGVPYRETVWPLLSRELGRTVDRSYYAFRYGSACFVFLDYGDYSMRGTGMDYAAQRRFLEETLAQAHADSSVRHVFVFGHFPLWSVARPGFDRERFTSSVLPAFTKYPVDAYFCGHTHNTGAWVRRAGGVPVTQIEGVALDRSVSLRAMDDTRASLIPRDELAYGWGYLSGPPDAFFLVRVDGPHVRVQFRSGRKVLREFTWREPGRITDTVAPPPRAVAPVTADDLRQASGASLVFTPWTAMRSQFIVKLNGEKIGMVRIEAMPDWAAFASETRVKIPVQKLKTLLRLDNEVSVENPDGALFGLGNFRIDLQRDGKTISHTAVADRFWFSAGKADAEAARQSTWGWDIIPPGVATAVTRGQNLGPVRLCFPTAN